MPKLSILVPTYNRQEKLIDLTKNILSPLKREHKSGLEIIIRDNSTCIKGYDISSIEKELMEMDYELNATNIGAEANIISLIQRSSCEFVWILADDDIYSLEAVAEIVRYTIKTKEVGAKILVPSFGFHTSKKVLGEFANKYDNIEDGLWKQEGPIQTLEIETGDLADNYGLPRLELLSSFICNRSLLYIASEDITEATKNILFHQKMILGSLERSSKIKLLRTEPYAYYRCSTVAEPIRQSITMNTYESSYREICLLKNRLLDAAQQIREHDIERHLMLYVAQIKEGSIAWDMSKGELNHYLKRKAWIYMNRGWLKLAAIAIGTMITPKSIIYRAREQRRKFRKRLMSRP